MAAPASRPLILVVDDEPIIAQLITDVLAGDGYDVDTASDGLVALECIGRRAYDLILSDLRMPELDGPGLYRELERRRPDLLARIAFVTGSAQTGNMEQFLEKTGVPILYKPFHVDQLTKLTTELLDRKL